MAECGTDAQIHVCRYEGGAQAWPSERRTGALSWRRTALDTSRIFESLEPVREAFFGSSLHLSKPKP